MTTDALPFFAFAFLSRAAPPLPSCCRLAAGLRSACACLGRIVSLSVLLVPQSSRSAFCCLHPDTDVARQRSCFRELSYHTHRSCIAYAYSACCRSSSGSTTLSPGRSVSRKAGCGGGGLRPHEGRLHSPVAVAQQARHLRRPLRESTSNGHGWSEEQR